MELRKHAIIRLSERCRLKPQDIQNILEKNQYCPIGIRGKHQHKLFYSLPDDECFVLVHDTETDEILTVLPINYHSSWIIDEYAEILAKKAILGNNYKKPSQLPTLLPPLPKAIKNLDHISISITTFSLSTRTINHLYEHKTVTQKHSQTQKIIDVPYQNLYNLNFPNIPITPETFKSEYETNTAFKLNLNTLIKKTAKEQNINTTNMSSIVINIYNLNKSFTLIRTKQIPYWEKHNNNTYETLNLECHAHTSI